MRGQNIAVSLEVRVTPSTSQILDIGDEVLVPDVFDRVQRSCAVVTAEMPAL